MRRELEFSGPISFIHRPKLISPSSHSVVPHGFKLHSNIKTFLKSAVWTSFSLCFIDNTISVGHTCVDFLVLNCSLEESFARFASQQTVVIARHLVTADWAQLLQAILGVRLAGADHTVLHVAACKDVARVSHDGRDVLRAGQAGHGVIILDGGGHPGHPIVGAGLHGHQVH